MPNSNTYNNSDPNEDLDLQELAEYGLGQLTPGAGLDEQQYFDGPLSDSLPGFNAFESAESILPGDYGEADRVRPYSTSDALGAPSADKVSLPDSPIIPHRQPHTESPLDPHVEANRDLAEGLEASIDPPQLADAAPPDFGERSRVPELPHAGDLPDTRGQFSLPGSEEGSQISLPGLDVELPASESRPVSPPGLDVPRPSRPSLPGLDVADVSSPRMDDPFGAPPLPRSRSVSPIEAQIQHNVTAELGYSEDLVDALNEAIGPKFHEARQQIIDEVSSILDQQLVMLDRRFVQ